MSYSFSINAATKAEAAQKIAAEFDTVVAGQPSHAADKEAAINAAASFVAVLREPTEGEHIAVSMSGSLGWRDENVFLNASVSIKAYIADNE